MKTRPSDLIRDVGWCQGETVKFRGNKPVAYCAYGALQGVYNEEVISAEIWHELLSVVQRIIGTAVVLWNDSHDRTKEEVIAVLENAENEVLGPRE